MTDLTQPDQKLGFEAGYSTVLIVNFGCSGVLSGVTQAVVDFEHRMPSEILANDLSALFEDMAGEFSQFATSNPSEIRLRSRAIQ